MTDQEHQSQGMQTQESSAFGKSRRSLRRSVCIAAGLTVLAAVGLTGFLSFRSNDDSSKSKPLNEKSYCPQDVPHLLASGSIQGHVVKGKDKQLGSAMLAPSCLVGDNPTGGYFYWTAPSNGYVTLASTTLLVDGCECLAMDSWTIDVQEGQMLRLYVPTNSDAKPPLAFEPLYENQVVCPDQVDLLDGTGAVADTTFLEQYGHSVVIPDCIRDTDQWQAGMYFEWQAPKDGQVTLASRTVLVNGCACVSTTQTFAVTAGHHLRLWTPMDEMWPIAFSPTTHHGASQHVPTIQFTSSSGGPSMCPDIIRTLDNYGFIHEPDGSLDVHSTEFWSEPHCPDDEDEVQDPSKLGLYFDWQAPGDGQVSLAPLTVLVDTETCACIVAPAAFRVQAGNVLRAWTPVRQPQPIQYQSV